MSNRSLACLQTRSHLSSEVLIDVVQKTLELKTMGPAVILWVDIALLCRASKTSARSMDFSDHMTTCAKSVKTFQDLEINGPIPLQDFVSKYGLTVGPEEASE
ncbi:unnamed protein product [Choristocarpus tenellus]